MPTLDVSKSDLEKLVGKKFSQGQLEETLEYVKGEIDGQDGDALKIDCKETNRPDLWSAEGLAREIKGRIGKEKGIPSYRVNKGHVNVHIDKNLEKVRPFIVCAVVKDIKITENLLIQMIQLQEKVGDTFGRKRKETGIGLYDFDIMHPPIYYKGFTNKQIEFIPLEWKVPMRPSEILNQHEKGKAYKHLLEGTKYYPIVIDSKDVVASMPPVINSESTGKVTEKTKNLFIEVTGFNLDIVETALEVMCMALADRGGKIYSCRIHFPKGKTYPSKSMYTPRFTRKTMSFDKEIINKKTGLDLKDKEIKDLLEKARFKVKIDKKKVHIEYPSYRRDIFHAVDIIEDLLISYGYNNIVPEKVEMSVVGEESKEVRFKDFIKSGCVGLGLQEVLTFNLTSKEVQGSKIQMPEEAEDCVEIANPVSQNYEILRKRLTPQLLQFLSRNKNQLYPQKIFEVGTTLELDGKAENGVRETTNLCITLCGNDANFTAIKSSFVTIAKYADLKVAVTKKEYPFLEIGAEIAVNGKRGFIGVLNKETMLAFGLKKPVAVLEFPLY